MASIGYKDLLDAGVHFGHMKKKWNPKMQPYIFMERKGIHIIDLNRTLQCMETSANAFRSIAKSGRKILFVATKKQARDIVKEAAESVNMPYVTERWLGGMMTKFFDHPQIGEKNAEYRPNARRRFAIEHYQKRASYAFKREAQARKSA